MVQWAYAVDPLHQGRFGCHVSCLAVGFKGHVANVTSKS